MLAAKGFFNSSTDAPEVFFERLDTLEPTVIQLGGIVYHIGSNQDDQFSCHHVGRLVRK